MKLISPVLVLSLFVSCSQIKGRNTALPTSLKEAVSSDLRTSHNVKRDKYRYPRETLEFFGLRPDMTVIEISPGAGWYTEILAPLLTKKGQYIMAAPPVTESSPAYAKANQEKVNKILERHPEVKAKARIVDFSPLTKKDMVRPGTADMIVTFRNVHNWVGNKSAQAAFHSFYRALKPGGVLGVVEHRRPDNAKIDPKSGYMSEKQVIALAQKAGFKLVARTQINANPRDKGHHPKGVWTLPPSLRLGDQDRAKYEAIGESDRMTLKFVKKK